ncbi:MAG: BBP7 family outer membrane beta-barrel protein [Planctomycetaceae bacterium]|nr:BBP7 family outer membrane beta-barrel protein [Planctomycetaceae bacterium]
MNKALTCALVTVAAAMLAAGAQAAGTQAAPTPSPQAQYANGDSPSSDPATAGDASTPDDAGYDNGLWPGEPPIGEGCSLCGGGCCTPPDWYTEQGVRFFGRTKPRNIPLGYVDTVLPAGDIGLSQYFSNHSASPNLSAAYDMTLGHWFARDTLNRDHFVEFSFFGLNRFEDQATVTAPQRLTSTVGTTSTTFGNLYSPYAVDIVPTNILTEIPQLNGTIVPGFDRVDQMSTYYASYMNNFELNGRIVPRGEQDQLVLHPDGKWRRECKPGRYMSYLYGVRFMKIDESFRFHGRGLTETFVDNQLVDSVTNVGEYDVSTHNNLLGLQIGADMIFRQCRWSWGVRAKVGPYINFADQTSDIAAGVENETPDFSHHVAEARHVASLIGEVGFTATYKFRPNLVGRASYDFMWVTGLALAPEQLQFTSTPVNQVNTNGTAVFHGPSLGLEWLW